jgi:hypothetical protein
MYRQDLRFVFSAMLFVALAVPAIATAQSTPSVRHGRMIPVARTAEDVRYHEVVERFASAEHLMLGVPNISDQQREHLERLESAARDEIFELALPLREARRTVLRGWPLEGDVYERAINAVVVRQRALFTDARGLLTPPQAAVYDANMVRFWSWLTGSLQKPLGVDTHPGAWTLYMNPYLRNAAIEPATTP